VIDESTSTLPHGRMDRTMGDRIADLRKRLGLTQEELAERVARAERESLRPGEEPPKRVTGQTVSKWERGVHGLEGERLRIVAQVLGTTRGFLLDGVVPREDVNAEPVPGLSDLFPASAPPTTEEIRWLRSHADFHRVSLSAMHATIMTMRLGLTPEQSVASREATERHRDPNVPPRRR
jgi:transcriptional regulator with XRE-family HTH domain